MSNDKVLMDDQTEELDLETVQRVERESSSFVGQWNQLISTTNWEKGAIICRWRELLLRLDLPDVAMTDQRWSQIVGGISPQHVGRLRRTSERFGHVYQQYEGLYWSHFYAALDWDDAEMWLEGAVQNRWSVNQMRRQRWETLGKIEGDEPLATDIVVTEPLEEVTALSPESQASLDDREIPAGPIPEGPDFGDADQPLGDRSASESQPGVSSDDPVERIRPFESFVDLPDDVSDVATAFKLAIIRHRADGWREISREDMLGLLDALKQLILADG